MVKEAAAEELQAMCSACYRPVPVAATHVQPGWNHQLNSYVTTYRCDGCRSADLAKTRARMAACTDPDELATGVLFFGRYGVAVPGLRPGDPPEVVREKLLVLIDRLAAGELRLRIDTKTVIPVKLPPAKP